MIAKLLSKIYHAMSKTKPKQTKYSAAQSLMHRQNTTTTNPHFSLTKYTSAFVYFLSKIYRIWNHMQQSCKQVKYLFLWVYYIEILFIIQKMCFLFNFQLNVNCGKEAIDNIEKRKQDKYLESWKDIIMNVNIHFIKLVKNLKYICKIPGKPCKLISSRYLFENLHDAGAAKIRA